MFEFTKFKVSKLYQNQGDKLPREIYAIDALKSYGDLSKVKFVHKFEPEKSNTTELLPAVNLNALNTKFLAFDVQFLHSQGLRSELVEISACDIHNLSQNFHISCYAFDEPTLKSSNPEFQSIGESYDSFFRKRALMKYQSQSQVIKVML